MVVSGTYTVDGTPVEGATIYVIDDEADPATIIGTATTDVNGDWSVAVGYTTTVHCLAEYQDTDGIVHTSESKPFVSVESGPAIVGSSSAGGWTSTITLSVPAEVSEGDTLLAIISHNSNPTMSIPSGWTQLYKQGTFAEKTFGYIYTATDSEPASYTFQASAAHNMSGIMQAIDGRYTLNQASVTHSQAETSSLPVPTVSANSGDLHLLTGYHPSYNGLSFDPAMTPIQTIQRLTTGYEQLGTSGTTVSRTLNAGTSGQMISTAMVFEP